MHFLLLLKNIYTYIYIGIHNTSEQHIMHLLKKGKETLNFKKLLIFCKINKNNLKSQEIKNLLDYFPPWIIIRDFLQN